MTFRKDNYQLHTVMTDENILSLKYSSLTVLNSETAKYLMIVENMPYMINKMNIENF